jgi:hypothetical protein
VGVGAGERGSGGSEFSFSRASASGRRGELCGEITGVEYAAGNMEQPGGAMSKYSARNSFAEGQTLRARLADHVAGFRAPEH